MTGPQTPRPPRAPRSARAPRREAPEKAGQLRAADPFDLIRLLARSQHDPRKAVAELVQNSLDAGARRVVVVRYQHRRQRCLSVRDDGEGVLPALAREEALGYIATNIGHSRKRDLSVEDRYRLLLQGKYGIGLLGFWSVGRRCEVRTKVGDEPAMVLGLEEDSPRYEIHRDRRELQLAGTWTEVVVVGLHDTAARQLGGRRLSQYLAEELRGQLLGREVELQVVDSLARGRARREFLVTPRRFEGVPLAELMVLDVAGHGAARLELYYLPPGMTAARSERGTLASDEPARVQLAASGTLVVEDLATIPGLDHAPWADGRLAGVVDFPRLEVAPGARRGFVPDAAAAALVESLLAAEPAITEALGRFETERRRDSDEELARSLRRLFADFGRRLPHYDLFEVAGGDRAAASAASAAARAPGTAAGGDTPGDVTPALEGAPPPGGVLDAAPPEAGVIEAGDEAEEDDAGAPAQVELFPAGPLHRVVIRPGGGELAVGRARRLRATAHDESGRRIAAGMRYHWRLEQGWALASLITVDDASTPRPPTPGLDVLDDGRGVRLLAGETMGTATVSVLAVQDERTARDSAAFAIVPLAGLRPDLGIPEPHPMHAPAEPWRSRILEGRWEYNSGHADYLATIGDGPRKLRYVAALLAKELVQRRAQRPEAAVLLEHMIEVLSWVERQLAAPARARRRAP